MTERSRPPLPGRARATELPTFDRLELGDGAQLLAIRMRGAPLVSLELTCPAGAELDPPHRRGLATFTAGLLDEGTARRSSSQIAADIEGLGGSLSTGADWSAAYLRAGLLAPHRGAALELLAELVTQPLFPVPEVERLRRQRLAELLRRRNEPGTQADERFARVLYGDGPYGGSLVGDEAAVESYSRDDCAGFYRAHFAPPGSFLLAAGDIAPEDLAARARDQFASWPAAAAASPPPAAAAPLPRAGVTVDIVDRPAAAQTELRMGHAAVPKRHPDRPALAVANSMLGGKFTSRINLNLRERHGFTYGAFSQFSERRGPGPFVVGAAVGNEVAGAAAREVLAELERLRQEPAPETEVAESRSYLLGVFPYGLQTVEDLVRKLAEIAVHGLPDDHHRRHLAAIEATSAADVQRVARAHLDPANAAIVAAGPAAILRPQLEALGPVTISPAPK